MMKIALVFWLIFLCSLPSNGQIQVKNDKSFQPHFDSDISYIDSLYNLEKNNDFELRFFAYTYYKSSSIFILSLKNSNWTARYFENINDTSVRMIELKLPQDSLENLWNTLLKNDLLTTKNAESIKDKKGRTLQLGILHGTFFYFDLMSKENKRSYWYHCPAAYTKEFPNIVAYKKIVGLIQTIFSFCKIEFRIC